MSVDAEALISELKRRRVFRALVGYGIAAFAVLQIIEPVMHGLHWPDEVLTYVVVALAVGFPIVVSLAWIFDLNAGRIERTEGGPRGWRLAALVLGIGALAAAPGTIWYFVVRGVAKAQPAAIATIDSIAVLPFVNLSSDKEQEYFSDGIAEEILNALAQVEGLHVTGRTSSFSFKDKKEDLRSIGQKLGVGAVVEGSVRKSGNRVRVSAQVVKVADGFHLWSQTYDRELTDIFAVQGEIARSVVDALKVRLLAAGTAPKLHPARDPEAYRLFLLGRSLLTRDTVESTSQALAALEKAVALEPSYAPSWALLSEGKASSARYAPRTEVPKLTREALDEAERAIAVDATYEGGYAARAYVRGWLLWDWAGSRSDLEHALALNPGSEDALSNYAGLMQKLGRLKEAIAVQRKVLEIDPLSATDWGDSCAYLTQDGQLGAARDACLHSNEISAGAADGLLFTLDLLEGHAAEALQKANRFDEDTRPLRLAIAQYELHRQRESDAALGQLVARADGSGGNAAFRIAVVHAWRSERDQAFEWLDRSYDRHEVALRLVKVDPYLRKLHGDPRWAAFLKKMNLPLD
jgi:TolB-like protein